MGLGLQLHRLTLGWASLKRTLGWLSAVVAPVRRWTLGGTLVSLTCSAKLPNAVTRRLAEVMNLGILGELVMVRRSYRFMTCSIFLPVRGMSVVSVVLNLVGANLPWLKLELIPIRMWVGPLSSCVVVVSVLTLDRELIDMLTLVVTKLLNGVVVLPHI